MPDYFAKSVFLQGHGEPGSIRIVKMGPGMTVILDSFHLYDLLKTNHFFCSLAVYIIWNPGI
jgi:hypothetical protein